MSEMTKEDKDKNDKLLDEINKIINDLAANHHEIALDVEKLIRNGKIPINGTTNEHVINALFEIDTDIKVIANYIFVQVYASNAVQIQLKELMNTKPLIQKLN